jgi:hypothetical protein
MSFRAMRKKRHARQEDVFGFRANAARSLATCIPKPGDTGKVLNRVFLSAGHGRWLLS